MKNKSNSTNVNISPISSSSSSSISSSKFVKADRNPDSQNGKRITNSISKAKAFTDTHQFFKSPLSSLSSFSPLPSLSLHYQQIYDAKFLSNWFYRFIFFCFGLLFLGLALAIFTKTVNFSCTEHFKHCFLVKNGLNTICLLLSGGAFTIGYFIQPANDAMNYLAGKVERDFKQSRRYPIEFHTLVAQLTGSAMSNSSNPSRRFHRLSDSGKICKIV